MTQEQADLLIADWQRKIINATDNLLSLDDTLAMKRIEGRDGFAAQPLTGMTAARVLPAIAAMRNLFGQIGAISAVVERACRLRRSLNRLWHYRETLDEIEHLLTGDSLPLPEIVVPLAQRNLLSTAANTQSISPERMLMAMTDAFATARDAVLSVEAAWSRWEPILNALTSKEATLAEQAQSLSLPVPPELSSAHHQREELQRRIASDPLGIPANSERDLAASLSAARTALESSRRERETVTANLLTARRLWGTLTEHAARVSRSGAACREILEGATVLPGVGPERLLPLEEWLVSLEAAAHETRWQAAEIGLQRWQETAQALQATLIAAEKSNQSLLDLPSELQGRLSVLTARMQAMHCSDITLERLVLQTKLLLEEPRLPVDRATKLIEACEERLRRETRGRNEKK